MGKFWKKLGVLAVALGACGLLACGGEKTPSESAEESSSDGSTPPTSSVEEQKPPKSLALECVALVDGGTITLEEGANYVVTGSNSFRMNGITLFEEQPLGAVRYATYLNQKKNVTIDGNGATVSLNKGDSFGYFSECEGITVKNLTIVYGEEGADSKAAAMLFEKCSNVKLENVQVKNGPARGVYVQKSVDFSADRLSYAAAEGATEFILSWTDSDGEMQLINSEIKGGGNALRVDAGDEATGTPTIVVNENSFEGLVGTGITLNANGEKVTVKSNEFTSVNGGALYVGNDFVSETVMERAICFDGNAVVSCGGFGSSGVLAFAQSEQAEGFSLYQAAVVNNTFTTLADGAYAVDAGIVGRFIYHNNTTDKDIAWDVDGAMVTVNTTSDPKVLLAIGDSITYGAYVFDDAWEMGRLENRYIDMVGERIGATETVNYAISGTCITPHPNTPVVNEALTNRAHLLKGGDIVYVAYGTNDFGCNLPLGEETDTTTDTFFGSIDVSFTQLKKNNPWAKTYLLLPIARTDFAWNNNLNTLGYSLEDYRNALRVKAAEYGFNVIEGGSQFTIDPFDPLQKEAFIRDGVHPNAPAQIAMAQMVVDGINGKTQPSLRFKTNCANIYTEDPYTIEPVFAGAERPLTWTSWDENIATVENGVVTGHSAGKGVIVATDDLGNQAVFVCYVKQELTPASDQLYLTLSSPYDQEETSVLYTAAGGPYRCNYAYVPSAAFRGDKNAVSFTVTIKQGGGYLFIMEAGNTDISTMWGNDAQYSMGIAIGPDYCGAFSYNEGVANYPCPNYSILTVKEVGGKDLTDTPVNWEVGKSYEITYRLPVGKALSFFYTKSVYYNRTAICWGPWNSNAYCYDVPNSLEFSDFTAVNMEGNAMIAREETFNVAGYTATVLIPANATGKWIWKTEFFYAFDAVERQLYADGFTRIYFAISDKYGSPDAVRLMYEFYQELMRRYDFLDAKGVLAGFSRGGLYAFNYALAHPECVDKLYLDAPVLDLRSWPRTEPEHNELYLHEQVMTEYGFKSEEEFLNYDAYPVGKLAEYFALNIPTILVAGANDQTVEFTENAGVMIDYCEQNDIDLVYYVKVGKVGGDHHPHSFGNVGGIDMYGVPYPTVFDGYSSEIEGSSKDNLVKINSEVDVITWFFE